MKAGTKLELEIPMLGVKAFFLNNKNGLSSNGGGKTLIICDHCGTPFYKAPRRIARSQRHFCSPGCKHEASKIRIPFSCVICGAETLRTPSDGGKRKTCGPQCASTGRSYNALRREKNARTKDGILISAVAKQEKMTKAAVLLRVRKGVEIHSSVRPNGENIRHAKLNRESVLAIRKRAEDAIATYGKIPYGLVAKVAREHGISYPTAKSVIDKKTWVWVLP